MYQAREMVKEMKETSANLDLSAVLCTYGEGMKVCQMAGYTCRDRHKQMSKWGAKSRSEQVQVFTTVEKQI
jgi:hypothetical protein